MDSVGKVCCGLFVRLELVGGVSEMPPLPVPLVFVANVPVLLTRKCREGQMKFEKLPSVAGTKCPESLVEKLRMIQCGRCPGFGRGRCRPCRADFPSRID